MCTEWSIPLRDVSSVLNVCFSAAWLAGIACILHLTYQFISEYTYVTVNCWFCNINARVPFKQKNEWFCTHCQQFNGFSTDGDYSKPIPEQYNENLNTKRTTSIRSNGSSLPTSNGLCRICNANQELKIKQIALYVPLREEEYDREIEQFREKLEKSYKLCSICERTVQSTLKLKSSLYSSKVPIKTENYLRRVSLVQPVHSRSWKYLVLLILATVFVVTVCKLNFVSFDVFSTNRVTGKLKELFEKASEVDNYINYDMAASAMLAVCAMLFINLYRGRISFFGSVVFGFIACATNNHLTWTPKICGIVLFFVYFVYKYMKRRKSSVQPFRKRSNTCELSDSEHENNESSPNDLVFSSMSNMNSPLCGKLSGLTLGQSHSISSKSRTSSYLFKSSRRLIQPSRLKLDDMDQPSDSSPTVSSGYESVTSFLHKTTDDVSEFDSISQVNNYRRNFIRNEPNALSRYYYPYRSSYFPTPEHYYGVSPVCSPTNQSNTSCSSKTEMNAFFSTLQIFLCSLAFFILGFSFQLLVTQIKF